MPIAIPKPQPEGFVATPLTGPAGFGAEITGIDLNTLSDHDFAKLQTALYRYKLLVIKRQHNMTAEAQYDLNVRFDPNTRGKHGDGKSTPGVKASISSQVSKRNFNTQIPDAPEVRVVGKGHIPAGHYGLLADQFLEGGSHIPFHKTPLTDEQVQSGETRLWRWHIDSPFYPNDAHVARVTTLWAHTLPRGPDLTLRFDDEQETTMKIPPGKTAFVDCAQMYQALSSEDKIWVDHSMVEYAPSPYAWTGDCKADNIGYSLISEGLEKPFDSLPGADMSKAQILPMVWPNAMTGEKAFMVHGFAARKLHIKRSANGPVTIVDDLGEVRRLLNRLQNDFIRPENIVMSPYEEGDLAVWLNRGCRHTAVEYPESYGTRIMHQCHLLASDSPANPEPIQAVRL